MNKYLYLTIVANIFAGISMIPEILKVIHDNNTDSFSYLWLILCLISNGLWLLYGLLIKDIGVLSMGIMASSFYCFLIISKIRNKTALKVR